VSTLEAMFLALAQSPDDWLLRAALADWFEEAGRQPVADCVRWMVRHRKRPYRSRDGHFHWFDAPRTPTLIDPESDIPEEVYRYLTGVAETYVPYRTYESLRAAEEDFHAAWLRARSRGWITHG
jgi:uncharacterized protein (TIGR02996 family)